MLVSRQAGEAEVLANNIIMLTDTQVIESIKKKIDGMTRILGALAPTELVTLFFEWDGTTPANETANKFLKKPFEERIALLKKTCQQLKSMKGRIVGYGAKQIDILGNDVITEAEWLLTEWIGSKKSERKEKDFQQKAKSMKIPFQKLSKRITGISTPVFGISWNPAASERQFATQLITYLEDRRVLYMPYELEVPEYAIRSVLEIRQYFNGFLEKVEIPSSIADSILAMRAACRKFLDKTQGLTVGNRVRLHTGGLDSMIFLTAVGELRGVFGIHIAQLCIRYGIDIGEELASILPSSEENDD